MLPLQIYFEAPKKLELNVLRVIFRNKIPHCPVLHTFMSVIQIQIQSAISELEQVDLPGYQTQTGVIDIVPATVGTEAVVELVCQGSRVLAVTPVVWRKIHVVSGRFTVVTFPSNY